MWLLISDIIKDSLSALLKATLGFVGSSGCECKARFLVAFRDVGLGWTRDFACASSMNSLTDQMRPFGS